MTGRRNDLGLLELWEEIDADPKWAHLRTEGIRLVPGVGASRPLAFVVGEAPGAMENTVGKPFVGASGKVLQQLMALAGMYAYEQWSHGSEDHPETTGAIEPNVWLTNAIKYRPPGNRTPGVREQMDATPYLRREWALVGKPKLIVCVGRVAAGAMGQIGPYPRHGDIWELRSPETRRDTGVYITYQYHPAFGLRGNQARRDMIERQWEDLGRNIEEMAEELEWEF